MFVLETVKNGESCDAVRKRPFEMGKLINTRVTSAKTRDVYINIQKPRVV